MGSSSILVPVEAASRSHCPAGWVLVLALICCTMPGPQRALPSFSAARQGSALGSVSKGSFRSAHLCAYPGKLFSAALKALWEKAELPMHAAGPEF